MSPLLSDGLVLGVARMVGIAILAGALSGAMSLGYRWYVHERMHAGLATLTGLSAVAIYLNATTALGTAVTSAALFDLQTVLFDGATLVVSAATARAGATAGDRLGRNVVDATAGDQVDEEVSRLVKTVGRVVTVEIPEDIDDIVGYDPVPDATKEQLAGRRFVFPRRLTVSELHDRLVTRLKSDYGVGHVDLELADDGSVEFLALGSRIAGIGPTLPPETAAVAIRADPAHSASAGDLVQVWETDPPQRIVTAEVRGTADDVVTIAVDVSDALKLDDETEYKLVTLPVETRPDREFASVLRAADETMAAVEIVPDSVLEGQPVGALTVSVVAVRDEEGNVQPLPPANQLLLGGDTLYLLDRPERLRKVETAASTEAPSVEPSVTAPETPTAGEATVGGPAAEAVGGEPESAEPSQARSLGSAADVEGNAETSEPTEPAAADAPSSSGSDASPSPESADDGEPASGSVDDGTDPEPDEDGPAPAQADADDESTPAAGDSSFQELKEEFESGDPDWDGEPESGPESGPGPGPESVDEITEAAEKADESTFEELKAEYEQEDGQGTPGDEVADSPDATGAEMDDATGNESGEGPATAGAGGSSFDELKDEYESGDADWDDEPAGTTDATDQPSDATDQAEPTGGTSFSDLKEEFESGDADWNDGDESNTSDDERSGDVDLDDVDELDEVDLVDEPSFDEIKADFESDDAPSEGDGSAAGDEPTDDVASRASESADEPEPDAGGGKSFSELKEEFESGDADWNDGDESHGASGSDDAGESSGNHADVSDESTATAGASSFDELKEEFESGDADWDDDVEIGGMALEPQTEEEKKLAQQLEEDDEEANEGSDDEATTSGSNDEGGAAEGGDEEESAADDGGDEEESDPADGRGDEEGDDPFEDLDEDLDDFEELDDDFEDLDEDLDDIEDESVFDEK